MKTYEYILGFIEYFTFYLQYAITTRNLNFRRASTTRRDKRHRTASYWLTCATSQQLGLLCRAYRILSQPCSSRGNGNVHKHKQFLNTCITKPNYTYNRKNMFLFYQLILTTLIKCVLDMRFQNIADNKLCILSTISVGNLA